MPPTLLRAVLLVVAVATLHPGVSPGLALAVGATIGLTVGNPEPSRTSLAARWLLRASIVGLGFGTSIGAVARVGADGVLVTAIAIALTLAAGWTLTRALRVDDTTGTLVSGGTAICGGSAIAALAPAIGASAEAMGVALGTVFLLNGVALYLFPFVGGLLDLSAHQFALWSAIAIHDTSSVVGAAAAYSDASLTEATVLKLVRALWIVPVTVAVTAWHRRRHRLDAPQTGDGLRGVFPWFIVAFAAASAVRAVVPGGEPVYDVIVAVARRGLVLTLFLIGLGFTRSALRRVGARPLLLGLVLWVLVGGVSLAAVTSLA